jgi:hypothetical protein
MEGRYLRLTEETNALDYLERAAQFIREADKDDSSWKWAIIALHGALYGFAICACKGPNCDIVAPMTKKGNRQLIGLGKALILCQDSQRMKMFVMSKHLVLSEDERTAIDKLQNDLRNKFEHYTPTRWSIEIHGMPSLSIHCLEVIQRLTATGNMMLSGEQFLRIKTLVSESISFLNSMPLHVELQAVRPTRI